MVDCTCTSLEVGTYRSTFHRPILVPLAGLPSITLYFSVSRGQDRHGPSINRSSEPFCYANIMHYLQIITAQNCKCSYKGVHNYLLISSCDDFEKTYPHTMMIRSILIPGAKLCIDVPNWEVRFQGRGAVYHQLYSWQSTTSKCNYKWSPRITKCHRRVTYTAGWRGVVHAQ